MSSLRRSLQTIYDTHGKLTPRLVVERARDPQHELHGSFEWDDSIAGEQYRLVQARRLIRAVRVTYRVGDEEHGVRRYMSIERVDPPDRVYEDVDDVLLDPLKRQIVLRQMERDFLIFKRRYAHLREYAELLQREANEGEAS